MHNCINKERLSVTLQLSTCVVTDMVSCQKVTIIKSFNSGHITG
jgi:hypothetical protein